MRKASARFISVKCGRAIAENIHLKFGRTAPSSGLGDVRRAKRMGMEDVKQFSQTVLSPKSQFARHSKS